MSEARADLRAAVRRLTHAVRNADVVKITVQRRDIELLLVVNAVRREASRLPMPNLHPEQR